MWTFEGMPFLEMTNLELISKVSSPGFEGMPFLEMTNSELISKVPLPGFESMPFLEMTKIKHGAKFEQNACCGV